MFVCGKPFLDQLTIDESFIYHCGTNLYNMSEIPSKECNFRH